MEAYYRQGNKPAAMNLRASGIFSFKTEKNSFRLRSISIYYIPYNHMFTRTVRSMTFFWSINKIVKNYVFYGYMNILV